MSASNSRPLLLLVSVVLLSLASGGPAMAKPAASGKSVPALAISENCKIVGNVAVLVSDIGMKCLCTSSKLTFVTRPPYTEVLVYSDVGKKIFHARGSDMKNSFFATMITVTGFNFADAELIPSLGKTIAAHPTQGYHTTPQFNQKLVSRIQHGEFGSRSAISLHCYYFRDLAIDERYGQFIDRLFSIPAGHGFPARTTFVRPNGELATYFETSSIAPAEMTAADLEAPKGYKTAASMQEILSDKSNGDALDWIK